MPVVPFEDLISTLPDGSVLAGLDLGTKTIGLALSDRSWQFAHPRPVLMRSKFTRDAEALAEFLRREQVAAIILGFPVNMDGGEGPRAQATRAFARNFDRVLALPMVLQDERLSTVAAERALLEMDVSRAKRAGRIDSAAAAFILQGALDRLRKLRRQNPAD